MASLKSFTQAIEQATGRSKGNSKSALKSSETTTPAKPDHSEKVRQPIYPNLFATNLQLLVDSVGAGDLKGVHGGLLGGIGDLTVVNDDHVAVGAALLVSPADGLGELGLGVGEEQLGKVSYLCLWMI